MITDNIKLKNHAHLHDFLLSYLTREFQIPREIIDLSCKEIAETLIIIEENMTL